MWITWANLLTAIRLLAIAPSVWAISTGRWGIAGTLFALAVVTDLLDGPLARRYHHASAMGGLFDHATDALFVSLNLAALALVGLLNPWLSGLVALAFIQYMFDSRVIAGAALKTSFLGKNNGIAYYVAVGIPVIREALEFQWPADQWIALLGWLLVATTLTSMTDRAIAYSKSR
jgi:phosphatidylglycerophosphate synthase